MDDPFINSMDELSSQNPYTLLFNALCSIPTWHYLLALLIFSITFLYNFLELHLLGDFFFGFRGSSIGLTYHPSSPIYNDVVAKCKILHGRYLATPWLASPHLQTCFLNFFGRPPVFSYRRQIFHASDGGTIALDWLLNSDGENKALNKHKVSSGAFHINSSISKDDTTPIVVVIPGLTSDSASPYLKHLAFGMAKSGWNVVVGNHRGLGGVSVTSDCFYNAGWTEDLRVVIDYLHEKYPKAPLFAVGTSIGANILVKYLGEDKEKTPVAGAVAICNPWDLVIGDRFICRRLVQKFYDRALAIGLQGYAQLHEPHYSRLANWEGIKKSRSIRDFDIHATCLVGKFETVDTYYRCCSSAYYVGNVSVPLLCISALDDPLCTSEAIPRDECRANKNIVLATSQHGGHLAFFEGLSGASLWWVRAAGEFLGVLQSTSHMHVPKKQTSGSHSLGQSSIDQGPYVSVGEDGMLAAVFSEQTNVKVEDSKQLQTHQHRKANETLPDACQREEDLREAKSDVVPDNIQTSEQATNTQDSELHNVAAQVRRSLNQISRQNRRSIWLLAFITVITSWPLVGSVYNIIFRRKQRNVFAATSMR